MSFSLFDLSQKNGSPVELYEITRGDQTWRFTPGASDYTYRSVVYRSTFVERDAIRYTPDSSKSELKLSFHRNNEFAATYLTASQILPAIVTILRGHRNDPDQEFITIWKGRVAGFSVTKNTVDISLSPNFSISRQPGLRAMFEVTCRHHLYSTRCGVVRDNYLQTTNITASANSGRTLTCPGAVSMGDGFYTGGTLVHLGIPYFILNHTGSTLTMYNATAGLGGQTVALYPGCDRRNQTCRSKFLNAVNFGGFPWMPSSNPFGGTSIR